MRLHLQRTVSAIHLRTFLALSRTQAERGQRGDEGGEGNAISEHSSLLLLTPHLFLAFCTVFNASLHNNLHLVIGMQRSEKWITDQRAVTTVITWTAGLRRNSSWWWGEMCEKGWGIVDKLLDSIITKCLTLPMLIDNTYFTRVPGLEMVSEGDSQGCRIGPRGSSSKW